MRHRIRVLYIGAVESKPLHKLSLTINNVKWRLALKNNDFVLFSQHMFDMSSWSNDYVHCSVLYYRNLADNDLQEQQLHSLRQTFCEKLRGNIKL